MIRWLYKFSSPKWFYNLSSGYLPWLTIITTILLVTGVTWGLLFSPPDYQMGHSYRIIYIHVPAAGLMEGCYYLIALMSITVLVWNIKMADIVAKACAPIGATATALMLATGAIWGVPTWGTWWTRDARLTSSLIMLFIYIGIIALRSAMNSEGNAAKACAVLALVGVVNVPIIKYSVTWWNTLHQPASPLSFRDTAANPPEIWIPAIFTGVGMIGFFLIVLSLRTRNEILLRERKAAWVQEMINES